MNKFINETLVIYISKFTNTKVIKALKDGMMFSLPFLMIGSLFLLIANLPIESVSKVISESGIGDVCSQVYSSTFSLMAFFTVIGITYSYLKNDQVITAINGALTGLAAFILLTPSSKVLDSGESVTGIISKDWTAGQGMICAILIGFLVGYIYSLCVKKDISIKMPDGVPSGVADSFSSLLPTGIIITICAIIYAICHFIFNTTFAGAIESEEPTIRNSNLLPVKANGDVLFLSVASLFKSGSVEAPVFNLPFCIELVASPLSISCITTSSNCSPRNIEMIAGGASLAPSL